MRKLLLLLALWPAIAWPQSVAVTSPTSGLAATGTIALTAALTSIPAAQVAFCDWILNGSYRITRVQYTGTCTATWYTWNAYDGPASMQAVVTTTAGTVYTSPSILFTVKNRGIVVTVNSPSNFQTNPTISGNITIDYTSTVSAANVENSMCTVDGMPIGFISSGYFTNPTYALIWNTSRLTNAPHFFACKSEQLAASVSPAAVGPGTVPTMQVQFVATTSNGHTVMAVKPDITDVVLNIGGNACAYGSWTPPCGSYQLAPILAYTDNTTGASAGLTYSADHDCNPVDPALPTWLFPCVSGNQYPLTSPPAQGAAYVTVTSGGLITAAAKGHSVVAVTDTSSGLIAYVNVIVQQYPSPPHFSSSGAVLHSYTPGQSILRTSMINLDSVSLVTEVGPLDGTTLLSHILASGYNAFEQDFWGSEGTYIPFRFGSEAAWQSAWAANLLPPFTNAFAAAPGLCAVLRSESLLQSKGLSDYLTGPSASWSPNPLTYAFATLQSTNKICGYETKDEVSTGWGFGPTASMKFSDGTLSSIVTSGCPGACLTRIFTTYNSPHNAQYCGAARFPGGNVQIHNATSAGLNGVVPVTRVWISNLNDYESHDTTCADGESQFAGQPPCQSFDVTTSAANGTYTVATDPLAEVLCYGDPAAFPVESGESPVPNNGFTAVTAASRAAGIPISWPTLAAGDLVTLNNWSSSAMADYDSIYRTEGSPDLGGTDKPAYAWGESFQFSQYSLMTRMWGEIANQSWADTLNGYPLPYLPFWRQDGTGYSDFQPDVPKGMEGSSGGMNYYTGGRIYTIASMSGACLTTTVPNLVATSSAAYLMPWVVSTVTGNSDAFMNQGSFSPGSNPWVGAWLLGEPCGSGGLEVYSAVPGLPGATSFGSTFPECTPSTTTPGTISIRGVLYNYNIAGFGLGNAGPQGVLGTIPTNIAPGEHVITAGNATSCWNTTWAFSNYRPDYGLNWFDIAPFVSSVGTGGTIQLNDDHGVFDPAQDFSNGEILKPEAIGPDMVFSAGLGFATYRNYQYQTLSALTNTARKSDAPFGSSIQTSAIPYLGAGLDGNRRWWANALATSLVTRIAPFNFGKYLPSPNFSSVSQYPLTWVQCTAHYSTNPGNILSCTNFSEIAQTITIDHTKYQIGTNPVSQYLHVYPGLHTSLLTGAQTTTTYTLPGGQSVVLLYHGGLASYVNNVPVTPPAVGGSVATVQVQVTYDYPNPIADDNFVFTCGSTTSCTLPLDTSLGQVFVRWIYLDSSGNVLQTSAIQSLTNSNIKTSNTGTSFVRNEPPADSPAGVSTGPTWNKPAVSAFQPLLWQ